MNIPEESGEAPETKPLVSVILAAYNVEDFLEEAVESLLSQSVSDLEIILVEDGSSDSTPAIVRNYEHLPNVRAFFHGTNRGLAAARNTGIRAATGMFIGFLDGDDVATPDMFREMTRAAIATGAEVVGCGHTSFAGDGPAKPAATRFPTNTVLSQTDLHLLLRRGHRDRLYWYNPLFIYSREFLMREKILFQEDIRLGEDTIFNVKALWTTKRFYALDERLYQVRQRQGSMTKPGQPLWDSRINSVYSELRDFYESQSMWNELASVDYHGYVIDFGLPQAIVNARALSVDRREFRGRLADLAQVEWVRNSLHHVRAWPMEVSKLKRSLVALLLLGHRYEFLAWLYWPHREDS